MKSMPQFLLQRATYRCHIRSITSAWTASAAPVVSTISSCGIRCCKAKQCCRQSSNCSGLRSSLRANITSPGAFYSSTRSGPGQAWASTQRDICLSRLRRSGCGTMRPKCTDQRGRICRGLGGTAPLSSGTTRPSSIRHRCTPQPRVPTSALGGAVRWHLYPVYSATVRPRKHRWVPAQPPLQRADSSSNNPFQPARAKHRRGQRIIR
jgi:hypothetical protein